MTFCPFAKISGLQMYSIPPSDKRETRCLRQLFAAKPIENIKKILFSYPNPFLDICYAYDGLVSAILPGVSDASGFFFKKTKTALLKKTMLIVQRCSCSCLSFRIKNQDIPGQISFLQNHPQADAWPAGLVLLCLRELNHIPPEENIGEHVTPTLRDS